MMSEQTVINLPTNVHKGLFLLRQDDIPLVQTTTTGKFVFELPLFRPNGDIVLLEIWNEERGTAAYKFFT